MAANAIVFLGVARISDQATLATFYDKSALNEERKGFEGAMATVLERSGAAYPGWRERAECHDCDGVIHAFADAQAICLTVVGIRDPQFSDRVALQMLRELGDKVRNSQGDEMLAEARVGALTTPLRKIMKDLMRNYNENGSQDKPAEVRQQVDQLKGIMQDNVKRILETHVTLESLDNSSSSMSSQANRFLKQSVDLRRELQWRNLKLKMLAGISIGAVALYFITFFVDF